MGLTDGAPSGDIDVDQILERVEGETPGGGGIPMERQPEPAAQPQAQPAAQEVEFTWNGKAVKAPWDKAKQWASQGYDYAQKMSAFNEARTAFEAERNSHKELIDRYREVDEYVKTNPQWWDHINSAYQQARGQVARAEAAQGGGDLPANHPLMQKLAGLESKLSELSQFKETVVQKETLQQREQEDTALTADIQTIREQYPHLDWKTADESGQNLELRVMKHALDHDIKNFKTAFRDYMHDELLKRAEEKGKEAVAKDRQKQTKLGLLGTSPAPKRGVSEVSDLKSKNYNDIEREIKEELGIA